MDCCMFRIQVIGICTVALKSTSAQVITRFWPCLVSSHYLSNLLWLFFLSSYNILKFIIYRQEEL
ncbi:hypothetical protein EDC01DRAFT_657061 [Geopyxis carbonaria]|nr:hypothetical protein EDC01DRAFT_657061 [Geopyxis carbonaria]